MRALPPVVLVTMLGFVLGSMLVGWAMGGPDVGSRRVLALATGTRNAALVLLVVTRELPSLRAVVAVLAYSALMALPSAIATVVWTFSGRAKRRRNRITPVRGARPMQPRES